jgi:hypothetical protein
MTAEYTARTGKDGDLAQKEFVSKTNTNLKEVFEQFKVGMATAKSKMKQQQERI